MVHPQTEEEIKKFYELTPFYVFDLAYWHMERRQKKFRDEVVEIASGDVLDYGGGIGDLCVKLAERGLNVTYGDVSGATFGFAQWLFEKRGYHIEAIDLEKENLSKQYDTIICIDVIEHLNRQEATLRRISGSLKKEGQLVITLLHGYDHAGWPMHLKIRFDGDELLKSLGLHKTDKKWLWVKAARMTVQQGLP